MNTDATEYSKSGTDDRAAGEQEAAFDPNLTSPESQHEKAGEGQGVSGFRTHRTYFTEATSCGVERDAKNILAAE